MTRENGEYLDCQWNQGFSYGTGSLYRPDWGLWQGELNPGKPSEGVLQLINGGVYTGSILNLDFHGIGKLVNPHGYEMEGVWEYGQLISGVMILEHFKHEGLPTVSLLM